MCFASHNLSYALNDRHLSTMYTANRATIVVPAMIARVFSAESVGYRPPTKWDHWRAIQPTQKAYSEYHVEPDIGRHHPPSFPQAVLAHYC